MGFEFRLRVEGRVHVYFGPGLKDDGEPNKKLHAIVGVLGCLGFIGQGFVVG